MTTKELLALVANTQVMQTSTTVVFIRVKDYPDDPKLKGLYFNAGWGTGGFKATPGSGHVFAHLLGSNILF